jgi:hypothetical protein
VFPKQGKRLAPLVCALLLSVIVALTVGVGAAVAQTEETTTTTEAPTTTTTESTTTTTAPCGYSEDTPCVVALGSRETTVYVVAFLGIFSGAGLAVLIAWTMRYVKGVESK